MDLEIDLSQYGIQVQDVVRNAPPAELYEQAIQRDKGARISDQGALVVYSGEKTGRSPKDKRIVDNPASHGDIHWGSINMKIDEETFLSNKERAIDYLNTRDRIYVFDGFAGWDLSQRLKIRVICTRPYHALFMNNMLIRPSREELRDFGEPDFVIFNGGEFPANSHTKYMTSKTSIDICFERGEFVILGTMYAGEMKKGVFTIMNYLMPKKKILPMHCSVNTGSEKEVSIFFGLSGTGKTTLSADPHRLLVGDDEHCWTGEGLFNIEGGCYAKCIHLDESKEPEIFHAIRFGTLLENVTFQDERRHVNFDDGSITENTRASYPIEYIDRVKLPAVSGHPNHIIFLTCDAFGVLPPVSLLTPEQAMYHFISGYTAKVAGTEVGVTEPEATFSACFGEAFMVWHPCVYGDLLSEKIREHGVNVWLVNTGWSGGGYGQGERMSIAHTRSIIDGIHDGSLLKSPTETFELFQLSVPKTCPNVPDEVMLPWLSWKSKEEYDQQANKLAGLFIENFKAYQDRASEAVLASGPKLKA